MTWILRKYNSAPCILIIALIKFPGLLDPSYKISFQATKRKFNLKARQEPAEERKAEKYFTKSPNGKTTWGNLTGTVDINIEPARRDSKNIGSDRKLYFHQPLWTILVWRLSLKLIKSFDYFPHLYEHITSVYWW